MALILIKTVIEEKNLWGLEANFEIQEKKEDGTLIVRTLFSLSSDFETSWYQVNSNLIGIQGKIDWEFL